MFMPSDQHGLADDVSVGKPHVVILGAGASLASCPDGDACGKHLPLMNNLVEVLGMADEFPPEVHDENFEEAYSTLATDPDQRELLVRVETAIRQYFSGLRLPRAATIYDHLVLGLRGKDVIATFNWDPLLVQAVERVHRAGQQPPELVFLHGNVAVGYCHEHKVMSYANGTCPVCRKPLTGSSLLYPIADKDYAKDEGIAEAWRFLARALEHAFMVTVFGYSAPVSDVAAKQLLTDAWGNPSERSLEQVEIIDIRPEEDLRETWKEFIHTHHYDVYSDFFDSSIATTPRRTGEAFVRRYVKAEWIDPNPAPRDLDLAKVVAWHDKLRSNE